MASVGSLVLDLVTNTASFTAGLQNARSELSSFQSYANSIKLDFGASLSEADDLTTSIARASVAIDDLSGNAAAINVVSAAFQEMAGSAGTAATQANALVSLVKQFKGLGGPALFATAAISAGAAIKWGIDQDAITAQQEAEKRRKEEEEVIAHAQFRRDVVAEQAQPTLRQEMANSADARRAAADAAAAFRAPAIAAMDAILNPLKSEGSTIGRTPAEVAAQQMDAALRPFFMEGRIGFDDFRAAIDQASAQAENNARASRDAADAAAAKALADDTAAKFFGFGLEALFGGNPGVGLAGLGDVRQKAASARGGANRAPAALQFGTNAAFTAEGNANNAIQQAQLDAQKKIVTNTQQAADQLAKFQGAAVYRIT